MKDTDTIRDILNRVRSGALPVETAADLLSRHQDEGFQELMYAKLDTDRRERTGFPEVVFCQGKDTDHLLKIFQMLLAAEGEVLGTRASREQYEALLPEIPGLSYDPRSRILKVGKNGKDMTGKVAVCTAGTSDIHVAEEAAQTAEFFGTAVTRIYDVGVSGIHRLISRLDMIRGASCVVAVAGMEGALPSVLGGMVSCPVIAVPTSVGYGTGLGGAAALMGMLNSCANGICVVNIDNGYGAGYIAAQINRLAYGHGHTDSE